MTILRILLLAAIISAVEVLITAVPLSIWVRRNGCKTATKVYFLKSNVSSGETFQYVLSALRRIDCIKIKRVRENRGYIKVKLRHKKPRCKCRIKFCITSDGLVALFPTVSCPPVTDKIWDIFLTEFLSSGVVFRNVQKACDCVKMIYASFKSPEYVTETVYETEYYPKVIGWESRTTERHITSKASSRDVIILFSNGRIYSGLLETKSKLYKDAVKFSNQQRLSK